MTKEQNEQAIEATIDLNRSKIERTLMDSNKGTENINNLLEFMDNIGFFTAPCSTEHHLAHKGGLAEHSLNVYYGMLDLDKALQADLDYSSIIICSLLHDLGKAGDHGKEGYIPNILKSGEVSSAKPFKTNPDLCYVAHEIRSIAIAERFISLTEEEEFAILYHNGMYGDLKYSYSGKETKLSMILHWADMWASRVWEV
jgi:23S rRNA maturation-related 3'-5' exoribonuclease YhaM